MISLHELIGIVDRYARHEGLDVLAARFEAMRVYCALIRKHA